jgi:electron transport complex protein RnfC
MLQLKTFNKGGIHPPEEKRSAGSPIVYGEIPASLLVAVDQHIGKPCKVTVAKGDVVTRCQVLAESTGFISSKVHSPVNGKVQKIFRFPLLGGQIREVVQITPDNAGESIKTLLDADEAQKIDIDKLDAAEIRKTISNAGIVGMGGAGFPTHVKLTPPDGKEIKELIINGAECEPYITADHRLMLEKTDEMLKGVLILQKLFGGVPVYIGIEENKPDALQVLDEAVKDLKDISVVPLKTKYPQGGEKQLIKAVVGREVPSKGLPMDVGVVVQNVATMLAVHDAFYYKRPLMERVLTVSGSLVKEPANLMMLIGTPVSHIMEKLDIKADEVSLMVSGGPMMGKTSYSFESPLTKTSSAVLFFDDSMVTVREENPCIRCGSCIDACPMGLAVAPYTEMVKAAQISSDAKDSIMDCIECGSCSYVCPADRRLVHWMRFGKNIIRREN